MRIKWKYNITIILRYFKKSKYSDHQIIICYLSFYDAHNHAKKTQTYPGTVFLGAMAYSASESIMWPILHLT